MLFDSELSGPQIARERFVSHNTLRGHTSHIVTSSTSPPGEAAVFRAQERGLMSPARRFGSHPVSHIVG